MEDRLPPPSERMHGVDAAMDVDTIRLINHGQNNNSVVVNEDLIFKRPLAEH